jgi:hypothetical protein
VLGNTVARELHARNGGWIEDSRKDWSPSNQLQQNFWIMQGRLEISMNHMYGRFQFCLWLDLLLCSIMHGRLEEYKCVFAAWFPGYLIRMLCSRDVPCSKNALDATALRQKCLTFCYKRRASPTQIPLLSSWRFIPITSWERPITRLISIY